ncbi:DUF4332 domain-containing protein [Candidatus Bathyarchaeota archaeon]|nr:DUF4332 domain-containing protein [Candidatus Bathyarchaeota archaeon]
MTLKKIFTVWILLTLVFLTVLGTIHAWTSLLADGAGSLAIIPPFLSNGFQIEVTTYFIAGLVMTSILLGATCYLIFSSEPLDLPLYQLSKDFEAKLEEKSQEIKSSTKETLAKLGLREFQLREGMKSLQKNVGELSEGLQKRIESQKKILEKAQKKLVEIERKTDKTLAGQRDIPKLKKKLQVLETVEKDLKKLQGVIEKVNSVPETYLTSTGNIDALGGKILKRGTVRRLKKNGFEKIEDLLLASPLEIAHTKAVSESEAKGLQSILQLLMVPGVQHEDAVLLLESGVNSKEELALQNTFSLGSRIVKTTELYIEEGKIKEEDKPSLEEIASWIKWART